MDKISREELVEKRKRELQERELENDLKKDLRISFQKLRLEDFFEDSGNPYTVAAIRFFTTLIVLYFLFFFSYYLLFFFLGFIGAIFPDWFVPAFFALDTFLHALIWIASIYSVYRKKSVIVDLVEFLV